MNLRYKRARCFLLIETMFIGIGAIYGAIMMWVDASGIETPMHGLLEGLQKLPGKGILYQNLLFPGIALFCINGMPQIGCFFFLLKNKKVGPVLSCFLGIILMLWISIQFFIYPINVLSISYFILGFLEFIIGFVCYVGYMQKRFVFDEKAYPLTNEHPEKLVIFFSRDGYTKKIAYQIASQKGASLYEIKTKEKIKGNLGFWWCGRFSISKIEMPIEECDLDFSRFEEITICTPIWAFSICDPVKTFLKQNKGKIKSVHYVLVHFMKVKFFNQAKKMDALLETKHLSFTSYSSHFGVINEIK